MSSILDCADRRLFARELLPRRLRLAAAALLVILTACAPRLRVPVDPAAFAAEVVDPASVPVRKLRSWMGSGRLHCRIDGRQGRGRIRVIFAVPHRLRADMELSGVFGLFGARSVLWAGEDGLIWQERSEPPARVDADALFSPVLGRAAGVHDLESLIFGLPALWERWPPGVEIVRRDDGYLLTARLPDGSEEAQVDGRPPVLRRLVRRDAKGRVIMDARFGHHQMVGGLAVARRLDVRAPVGGNELRIDWKRIEPDWPEAEAGLGWPEVEAAP